MELSNWFINENGELCAKMKNTYMVIVSFSNSIYGWNYVYRGKDVK